MAMAQRVVYLSGLNSHLLKGDVPDMAQGVTQELVSEAGRRVLRDAPKQISAYEEGEALPWLLTKGGWKIHTLLPVGKSDVYVVLERSESD